MHQGCLDIEDVHLRVERIARQLAQRIVEFHPRRFDRKRLLNNLVEQDHRAVKRITRPMLEFKTFLCARILIAGIEVMHMIRKGQLGAVKDQASSAANQFYSLVF